MRQRESAQASWISAGSAGLAFGSPFFLEDEQASLGGRASYCSRCAARQRVTVHHSCRFEQRRLRRLHLSAPRGHGGKRLPRGVAVRQRPSNGADCLWLRGRAPRSAALWVWSLRRAGRRGSKAETPPPPALQVPDDDALDPPAHTVTLPPRQRGHARRWRPHPRHIRSSKRRRSVARAPSLRGPARVRRLIAVGLGGASSATAHLVVGAPAWFPMTVAHGSGHLSRPRVAEQSRYWLLCALMLILLPRPGVLLGLLGGGSFGEDAIRERGTRGRGRPAGGALRPCHRPERS